jgi:predicted phage terminase large subunit-like protein
MDSKLEPVKYSKEQKCWVPSPDGEHKKYCVDPRTEENELLWPTRMDRVSIERDKKVMGSYAVAGQFQQRPAPRGGGMFQEAWFEIVETVPANARIRKRVRGWDLAASKEKKSPYTAGVMISQAVDGTFYIEHCSRGKGSANEAEQRIKNTASQDGKNVKISIPQDPGQAGKAQKLYFAKLLVGYDVRFSPETGSKEVRAEPLSAQAEAGNVKIVRGSWNRDFLDELCLFPNSMFKDQVDAASRAFMELVTRQVATPAGPETVQMSEPSEFSG